ncbi:MAG: AbrB/MazE/SpoVT family DNA-binding domain-containing protein [Caulobacteraceae bacterium]
MTTTLSTKGQVIVPKALRARRKWRAGTKLVAEETADGVLLRPASDFEPTRSEEIFGCLKRPGPPLSIEEMDAAVQAEAVRRHAGR